MARAEIQPGNCGHITIVEAKMTGEGRVSLSIESECQAIQRLAEHLTEVDPRQEISFRGGMPSVLAMAAEYCSHAACPVPVGIIKAVEVAAGLALPGEVTIKLTK